MKSAIQKILNQWHIFQIHYKSIVHIIKKIQINATYIWNHLKSTMSSSRIFTQNNKMNGICFWNISNLTESTQNKNNQSSILLRKI
jgi:methionine synthase II (cobalamin-independent)